MTSAINLENFSLDNYIKGEKRKTSRKGPGGVGVADSSKFDVPGVTHPLVEAVGREESANHAPMSEAEVVPTGEPSARTLHPRVALPPADVLLS